jgi:hypothetical protein
MPGQAVALPDHPQRSKVLITSALAGERLGVSRRPIPQRGFFSHAGSRDWHSDKTEF